MSPAKSPDHLASLLVSRKSPGETPAFTATLESWETWRHGDIVLKNYSQFLYMPD